MPKIKSLDAGLKQANAPRPAEPVWEGPSGTGPNGGCTFSLISRYLQCKERFRIQVIEGLRPRDTFEPRLEFGNCWHVCEECLAGTPGTTYYLDELLNYCKELCKRYPLDREKIGHWYNVTRVLFPRYVEHWAAHPDVTGRTPLLAEQVFDVPYSLPSGRAVRLRGKWDSVGLVDGGVWLQENKTKGTIDTVKINRQLSFDLQVQFYLVALQEATKGGGSCRKKEEEMVEQEILRLLQKHPIVGVRYNCIRRPAHKSTESMLEKLGVDCRNGRAGEWFARWNVTVLPSDVERFRRECLDPVLENLCDDYGWWDACKRQSKKVSIRGVETKSWDVWDSWLRHDQFPHHYPRHYVFPFLGYAPLAEGGEGDVDEHMRSGSEVGLQRVTNLFPEL